MTIWCEYVYYIIFCDVLFIWPLQSLLLLLEMSTLSEDRGHPQLKKMILKHQMKPSIHSSISCPSKGWIHSPYCVKWALCSFILYPVLYFQLSREWPWPTSPPWTCPLWTKTSPLLGRKTGSARRRASWLHRRQVGWARMNVPLPMAPRPRRLLFWIGFLGRARKPTACSTGRFDRKCRSEPSPRR